MEITIGNIYFIKDSFFEKVCDPYLKINYADTKRPHYFAFQDEATSLYWLVPCSSRVEKFERILENKREQHKPTDTIKIVKIQDKKTALLFQDMFPMIDSYIDGLYIRGGQVVRIADPRLISELEKTAHKVIKLIRKGVRFTPTQPDALRIEKMMLEELKEQKN